MGRLICAWCQKEGKTEAMIMGEASTEEDSHGVCDSHQQKMLIEIAQLKQRRPTANPKRRRVR